MSYRVQPRSARLTLFALSALVVVLAAGAGAYLVWRDRSAGLPAAGSPDYVEVVRRFNLGLARLEAGLIDAAVEDFIQASLRAPGEPAIWADLGLAHARLGAFEPAASALARAAADAPADASIAFLQGRLEVARGQRDAGVLHFRRVLELDPSSVRARAALAEMLDEAGAEADGVEARRLLEQVSSLEPDNLAALIERTRLAAKHRDADEVAALLARLEPLSAAWPDEAAEQFRTVQRVASQSPSDAALEMAFLRNLLAQVPEFAEGRRRMTAAAESVGEPLRAFVRLAPMRNAPSEPDRDLTFTTDLVPGPETSAWQTLSAVSLDGLQPPVLVVADQETVQLAGRPVSLIVPGGALEAPPGPHTVLAVDWNNDARQDLAVGGASGVRLYLQRENGTFADATADASRTSGPITVEARGVWAADVEMDGDLDLIVGARAAPSLVLRNNGNGEWTRVTPFGGVTDAVALLWGDVDADADPDVVMADADGALHVFLNLQGGVFQPAAAPFLAAPVRSMALADVDADGRFEIVTLGADGRVRRSVHNGRGTWQSVEWARVASGNVAPGARVFVADVDNNGALDLVVSGPASASIWLSDAAGGLVEVGASVRAVIHAVADLDGDGRLDLAGLANGRPVRFLNASSRGYHFRVVRPRALTAAGDQRINSFGIGGLVEVRSGDLVQAQMVTGPLVHVGLGTSTSVDVTRIVWPNGVAQAEFEGPVDLAITAEQRLKGSCPWVFANDGTGLRFVTDFLWRSPLGLKINAQDTAGVTQTEDWVKIRGDQLAPVDGRYDIRISAELWETHFVDHVALMAVDHRDDVEVFVDERFVPGAPPTLTVHATARPNPVRRARDHRGRDVTDLVARTDGAYAATFTRGRYQGLAEPHWIEFDVDRLEQGDAPLWLIAHGWIYPTDSSLNVAIGQGGHVVPESLALDAQDASGRWVPVSTGLGFPAGKLKTVLIDLRPIAAAGLGRARRVRLRTNLEISWDSIATAAGVPDAPLDTRRLAPVAADLRYRGYSQTTVERDRPEVPRYDRLANTTPRWRDLVGHYTRFGDVRELLGGVEDRYVIMNAGDELRLSFDALAPVAPGWARDFVLIGDGWVKDGDYNTSASRTVLPLPTHATGDYHPVRGEPTLGADPVYRRHRDDWRRFHTRYVTAEPFVSGLRRPDRVTAP